MNLKNQKPQDDGNWEKLEAAVTARKALLRKIVRPISETVKKHGEITDKFDDGTHVRIEYRLLDFGGFSFRRIYDAVDLSMTWIAVWDNPSQSGRPILDLHFMEDEYDDVTISIFNEETNWVGKLQDALNRRREIITVKRKTIRRREEILADGRNLGLTPPF